MAFDLQIAEQRLNDVVVLSLKGWLVPDEQDVLFRDHIDTLVREGVTRVVVDLRELTLFDSGGAGVLIAKLLTLRRQGGDLRLARVTDRTRRVLSNTRLLSVFAVYDSVEEAARSFATDAPRAALVGSLGPDRSAP